MLPFGNVFGRWRLFFRFFRDAGYSTRPLSRAIVGPAADFQPQFRLPARQHLGPHRLHGAWLPGSAPRGRCRSLVQRWRRSHSVVEWPSDRHHRAFHGLARGSHCRLARMAHHSFGRRQRPYSATNASATSCPAIASASTTKSPASPYRHLATARLPARIRSRCSGMRSAASRARRTPLFLPPGSESRTRQAHLLSSIPSSASPTICV